MKISVTLSTPYTIYVNDGTIQDHLIPLIKTISGHGKIVIITNKILQNLYASFLNTMEQILSCSVVAIQDGEEYKSIETAHTLLDRLVEMKCDRQTIIIAFGGGVVGDLAGFVASIFLRGVPYIQIPTTLLAMVDSSIGGKTGVNLSAGKNLVGSFHQPSFVWIETGFLKTLPDRQFICGYGEIIKYAFIAGREFFDYLTKNHDQLIKKDDTVLLELILRCAQNKARIVASDERESGLRMLLNFGHTIAHAIEKYYEYTHILHGEAVLWGILSIYTLAKNSGRIAPEHIPTFEQLTKAISLPSLPTKPDLEKIYTAMFTDKKMSGGKLTFVVPTEPGEAKCVRDVTDQEIHETLQKVLIDKIY